MSAFDPNLGKPAAGEEIRMPTTRSVLDMAFCGLVIAGGALFVVAWPHSGKLTVASSACIAVGSGGLLELSRRMLRDRRLLIGQDRVQVVEAHADVIGEITYDNIACIGLAELGRSKQQFIR